MTTASKILEGIDEIGLDQVLLHLGPSPPSSPPLLAVAVMDKPAEGDAAVLDNPVFRVRMNQGGGVTHIGAWIHAFNSDLPSHGELFAWRYAVRF